MRTLIHAARLDQTQRRNREALEKCLLALELVPRANDLAAETKYPFTQEELDIILNNDASAWFTGK